MARTRVYYIRGRARGSRYVDDVDRAEGAAELFYLFNEYRMAYAYGRDYDLWVTNASGRRISLDEVE